MSRISHIDAYLVLSYMIGIFIDEYIVCDDVLT